MPFLVAVLVILCPTPSYTQEGYNKFLREYPSMLSGDAKFREDAETALLMAVNSYRRSKGLKPLRPLPGLLQDAARAHALDLMLMGKMGHVASTGQDFESRMRSLHPGRMVLPRMGENAARDRQAGKTIAERVQGIVMQWINSPAHRKAMTSRDYVSVATGVVVRGEEAYAVQIFQGPEVKTNFSIGTPEP